MTGVNFGILDEKVVPDTSSSLDDPRERAETIQANHRDMARFRGADDPNYVKVGGELKTIVKSLSCTTPSLTDQEKYSLATLSLPAMIQRQQNIHDALANTCEWCQTSIEYQNWSSRQNVKADHGLLWVKECLAEGADPDDSGSTLHSAPLIATVSQSEEASTRLVKALLHHGANVNAQDPDGRAATLICFRRGYFKLAQLLVDSGANVDIPDSSGVTPLHIVANMKPEGGSKGKPECSATLRQLLEKNPGLDARTQSGSTPLHFAAASANHVAASLLLDHGASVDLHDFDGPPLLHAVCSPRNEAADPCKLLLSRGADAAFRDKKKRTFLHHAAYSSLVSSGAVLRCLIEAGVEVNAVDHLGQTALHRAAERVGDITMLLRALVDSGCDVSLRDAMRQTALDVRRNFHGTMSDEEKRLLQGYSSDNLSLPIRPVQAQFSWDGYMDSITRIFSD
ncbi:hypothetical protein PG994_004887 [Apiospora phragmitis]|uniref:Ankyrin repeat protein n=1 Tax=Apiospora phragmitis TaxID=2905665 RepID=A0ABR1VRZ1_9PEZI